MSFPIVQLPLFDNKPLPEIIVEQLGGTMQYIDHDNERLYSIRDWVYIVSQSTAKDRGSSWRKLKSVLMNQYPEVVTFLHTLAIDTPGGRQSSDFANANGLYLITQRMDDKSSSVRGVKKYLADAGVYADNVRLNPELEAQHILDYARRKEISALINEGFTHDEAEQWVANRIEQKQERKITVGEWNKRGAKGREFGRLTNAVTSVAIGQSARELKEQMGITDSLRDHLSTAQNVAIKITEFTSRMLHIGRNSEGVEELMDDIQDTRPIIDAARPEIERAFSKKPRRLKNQDQPKLLKDDSHE